MYNKSYNPERPSEVRQGQIYYVDLPVVTGSVQHGLRPVVVTSSNTRNRTSPVVIVAIITSQLKQLRMKEHVRLSKLDGLPKNSMVCCEQRFTIDKRQLLQYKGMIPWTVWKDVRRALKQSERSKKKDYEEGIASVKTNRGDFYIINDKNNRG